MLALRTRLGPTWQLVPVPRYPASAGKPVIDIIFSKPAQPAKSLVIVMSAGHGLVCGQQQHRMCWNWLQIQEQYARVMDRAAKEEKEVEDLIQIREQAYLDLLEGGSAVHKVIAQH